MAAKRDIITSSLVEDDGDNPVVEDIRTDDCTAAPSSDATAGQEAAVLQSNSIARLDRFPARIAGLTGWTMAEARVFQVTCRNVHEELRCFEGTAWFHRSAKQKQPVYDMVQLRLSALQGPDVQRNHWDWLIEDVYYRLYRNHRDNLRYRERREKAKQVFKASKVIPSQQPPRATAKPQRMESFLKDAKHDGLRYRKKAVEELVTAKIEKLLEAGLEADLAKRLMYKAIKKALPEATDASQKAHCNLKDGEARLSHPAIDGRTFRWFKPALRKMAFQHEDQENSFHAKAEDVASRAFQAVKGALKARLISAAADKA